MMADIILILLVISSFYQCDGYMECKANKPFLTGSGNCANFIETCLKTSDAKCAKILDGCKQCPPSNFTVKILIDIIKLLSDEQNNTKTLKKVNALVFKLENISIIKEVNAILFKLENISCIKAFCGAIIIISLLVGLFGIILMLVEVRFKIITKWYEKCMKKGSKRVYREEKQKKYKLLISNSDMPIVETEDNLLGKLTEFKSKFYTDFTTLMEKFQCLVPYSEIRFSISNLRDPIIFFVRNDENIIRIKQKIYAKMINAKENDYKRMKLKYNGNILEDDNNYLLEHIRSNNLVVNVEFLETIIPEDIIVVKLRGLMDIPEIIQVNKKQTIAEIKLIVSKFTKSKDFFIFYKSKLLMDNLTVDSYNLMDNDWIKVVERMEESKKIIPLFHDGLDGNINYSNEELVSNLKGKLAQKLHSTADNIILFFDKTYFPDDKYLCEIGTIKDCNIKYCLVKRTDLLNIGHDIIKTGDSSQIMNATENGTGKNIILKKYNAQFPLNYDKNKNFLSELISFQVTKSKKSFVQLLDLYKDTNNLYIAMEAMSGKTVTQLISDLPIEGDNSHIKEEDIAIWSKQILQALELLHKEKIIHRNLKPTNIFIDENNNVKLSNFGLSKYAQEYNDNELLSGFPQTKITTKRYMAPEVLSSEPFGVKVDVWSFGAVLVEIVTNKIPLLHLNETAAMQEIVITRSISFEMPEIYSSKLSNFIKRCLDGDPKKRKTVDELLSDTFLNN